MSKIDALTQPDKWSNVAKSYSLMATKFPVVSHFSDVASDILLQVQPSPFDSPHATFLDVCAGPATYTLSVMKGLGSERAKTVSFIISDFSSGMVDAARTAVEANFPEVKDVSFKIIDVQNIELPPDSAEVVACMFGYFVSDRQKAFAEVCRVTKLGGKAVIGTWKYACFAYLLGDFLVHLGKTETTYNADAAHVCADGDRLREELLQLGFSEVVVHECERVFELPLSDEDIILGILANPMICAYLTDFTPEHLLAEWGKFVRAPGFSYPVDVEKDILYVKYVANIVVCTK